MKKNFHWVKLIKNEYDSLPLNQQNDVLPQGYKIPSDADKKKVEMAFNEAEQKSMNQNDTQSRSS